MEEDAARTTDPIARQGMEGQLKAAKARMDLLGAPEQQQRAREAELASKAQAEQARLTELHDRIDQMERALDAAIRQATGQR